VRDHYVRELFGIDPTTVRAADPQRYLDFGRAATAEVLARTFTEWRRPASPCTGALLLQHRDLDEGPGPGLVDAHGRPKPAYYGARRVLQPVALLLCDEGMNGLDIWAVNDSARVIDGVLTIETFNGETRTAVAERSFVVPGQSHRRLRAEDVLGGFVDITYAYRFGPQRVETVAVRWAQRDGTPLARAIYHPDAGPLVRTDVGLSGRARVTGVDRYEVEVSARRAARWVLLDAPGAAFSDNAFDIEPGGTVVVEATSTRRLRARARAVNGTAAITIAVDDH
jgi:beta-mannosidase